MRVFVTAMAVILVLLAGPAHSQQDAGDLAKQSQNPVGNMISLPLQNNTNFGVGPGDDVQNVLNIQPVIPFSMTENWNLITRTIAPLIYQPDLVPGAGSEFGLGDINMTLVLCRRQRPAGRQSVPVSEITIH